MTEWVANLSLQILIESWHILLDAAPYLFLGFFMAGLLKAYLPDQLVQRHLGGKGPWGIIKASLMGVPIPL